eukprot:1677726-Alexandrium_andersonii.AAC.1
MGGSFAIWGERPEPDLSGSLDPLDPQPDDDDGSSRGDPVADGGDGGGDGAITPAAPDPRGGSQARARGEAARPSTLPPPPPPPTAPFALGEPAR